MRTPRIEDLLKRPAGIKYGWLKVTPELAERLLEYNVENYRKVDLQRVEYLADAILDGKWFLNMTDPITLQKRDRAYVGINGQHRLHAIVRAGRGVPLMFCVVDSKVEIQIHSLDGQRARNLKQYITYRGYANGNTCAPIARMLVAHERTGRSQSQGPIDIQDGWNAFLKYKDGILFSADLTQRNATGVNASYRTAMTRAYYHVHKERLQTFHQQFTESLCDNPKTDRAATLLHRWFTDTLARGEVDRHTYYLHCERALYAFGQCENIKSLKQLSPVENVGDLLPLS